MHFKILSAICFILDQSKILSSGNGLNLVLNLISQQMTNSLTDHKTGDSDLHSYFHVIILLKHPFYLLLAASISVRHIEFVGNGLKKKWRKRETQQIGKV